MRADDASDRIERPLNQSHLPPTTVETDRGEKILARRCYDVKEKKNGGKKMGSGAVNHDLKRQTADVISIP